ncbi:hypothetical protein [Microcella flavibacter]|uniref:hypothetical protein n=1 Tax=Microcella flavibacter TaxID=1804990 RepID=UPI00145747A3|nr:hypothetical protein [Microcella flavibacter]
MSDEQLRTALDRAAEGAPRASRLDVDAAVRASRARRLPAQLLVGATAAVLVIGGGGIALGALPGTGAFTSAADESADAPAAGGAEADGEGAAGSDPGALPSCGAAPAAAGVDAGLELIVEATGAAAADGVPVRITLRSTADAPRELRVASAPTTALARDGRVLGAAGSAGAAATPFTLAPDQERSWTTVVPAISCATGAAIPSVDVNDAELLAAVAVELLDAGGEVVAVTSAPAPITAP